MAKTPEPIAPRHPHNPVGQTEKIARAMKAVRKDLLRLQKQVVREWEAMPVQVQNAGLHNQFYEYLIDLSLLRSIVAQVKDGMTNGEGSKQMSRQTEAAYINGTAMAAENLSRLTDDYTRQVTAHLGSQIVQRRAALAGARVFEQMEGMAGQLGTELGRVMFSAVQSGENPRETAKRLRGRFGVSKSRAERIARTEITGALRRGRWDEARDAQDKFGFETRLIHYSALIPGRTRDSHARRHGQIVTIEEQARWYERDGNAINCFLPGTRVAGQFVAGSKARYEGPAVRIVTASGNDLSVTPNHPVMTDRGLIAAAEIQKGDNLIAYQPNIKNFAGVGSLNGDLVNSAIENVYCSLVDLGHAVATGVRAVDFHGDGRFVNEDIQVVDIEGVLPVASDAPLAQLLQDFSFVKPDTVAKGKGAFGFDFHAVNSAAPSIMGGGNASLPLGWAEPSALDALRVASASDGQAALCEPALNGGPADAVFLADCQDRKPSDVVNVHGSDVMPSFKRGALACVETHGDKPFMNGSVTNADAIRDLLERFAGLAALDKVVNIDRFTFAGHVYDLQDVSGLMVAGGVITSNCLCSSTEVIVDSDGKPVTGEKLRGRMKDAKDKFEREEAKQ